MIFGIQIYNALTFVTMLFRRQTFNIFSIPVPAGRYDGRNLDFVTKLSTVTNASDIVSTSFVTTNLGHNCLIFAVRL